MWWRGRPGGRFDLGFLLGLDLLFGEGGPIVVVVGALGEEPGRCRFRLGSRWPGLCLLPVLFDRPAVHAERAGKRLDRGEQALLETRDQQGGGRLLFLGLARQTGFAEFAVLIEQLGQAQLGRVGWQSLEVDLAGNAFGKSAFDLAQVFLQPAHHDLVEKLLARTGTPRQKRCGSRISSSAEKLLEWPLCGVAERKRRCSNRRPARARPW